MRERPFSAACERNKAPILRELQALLPMPATVLEIGSGSGQHGVHFCSMLADLVWHASDRAENLEGIRAWVSQAALPNLKGPHRLDVMQDPWPDIPIDAVFSANTAHIMHWDAVERMFAGVGRQLSAGGLFLLYGPFSRHGRHNSDSNLAFHRQLQQQDPGMGLRDLDELQALARSCDLALLEVREMPANNRLIVFRRF